MDELMPPAADQPDAAVTRREQLQPQSIIFARHDLPRPEYQLVTALLYFSRQALPQQRHGVDTERLRLYLGYRRRDLWHLRKAFVSLRSRVVELGQPDQDDTHWVTGWINRGGVTSRHVAWEYPPEVARELHDCVHHARLDPARIHRLGYYGQRLYEICRWYLSHGATPYAPIEAWREYFLGGPRPAKYPTYKEFSRYIVRRAAREVTEATELTVIPSTRKTGKRVTHLAFECTTDPAEEAKIGQEIRGDSLAAMLTLGIGDHRVVGAGRQHQAVADADPRHAPADERVGQLLDHYAHRYGLSPHLLRREYGDISYERLSALIDQLAAKPASFRPSTSWAAWARGALKNAYHSPEPPQPPQQGPAPQGHDTTPPAHQPQRDARERRDLAEKHYAALDAHQQAKITNHFENCMGRQLLAMREQYPDADYQAHRATWFYDWLADRLQL